VHPVVTITTDAASDATPAESLIFAAVAILTF